MEPIEFSRLARLDGENPCAEAIVYNLCTIVTMPVEMVLRPQYGSRYCPPVIMFFAAAMMMLLPFFSDIADSVSHMLPFARFRGPVGFFAIGSLSKFYFLGSFIHGLRIWRRSKSQAEAKRDELLNEVNARNALAPDPNITFDEFLEGIALPFLRSKWKRSTAATAENRINHRLKTEFGEGRLSALTLKGLQANGKAETLSRSVVAHLRWDLRAIFQLAIAEGYAERDPTGALFKPKAAATAEAGP